MFLDIFVNECDVLLWVDIRGSPAKISVSPFTPPWNTALPKNLRFYSTGQALTLFALTQKRSRVSSLSGVEVHPFHSKKTCALCIFLINFVFKGIMIVLCSAIACNYLHVACKTPEGVSTTALQNS